MLNWRKWFKKGANPQAGLQKLDKTITLLEKKEVLLEAKCKGLRERAKELARKGNKRLALQLLKRKKEFEKQLQMFSNQKMNMQSIYDKIDQQITNMEVMKMTKESQGTMKNLMGKDTVEDIQETVDDLRDQMADVNEVSSALADDVTGTDMLDVDDDLNDLFAQVAEERMTQVDLPQSKLPQKQGNKVAQKKPSVANAAEEEAAQLLAELAL